MATTTAGGVLLSHATLCPPPLLIQKKLRRATFRRRILRKSTQSQNSDQYVFGPLDDIIDEIKSNIWESPPDYSFDSSVHDWANSLNVPSTWAVTPLPVSRIPSDHPLTIRKNRNSRSSASGSSIGDAMAYSRNNSQDEAMNGGAVGPPYTPSIIPWPSLDTATSYEPAFPPSPLGFTIGTEHSTAQQALENVIHDAEARPDATKRRPSRLRFFTNGFPRLRRTGTGDTSGSAGDIADTPSPTTFVSRAAHKEIEVDLDENDPSEELVDAFMRKHARNGSKFRSVMEHIARRLPSPTGDQHEHSDDQILTKMSTMPTTLRAAVRIFPETKILTKDSQDLTIAIEIEGVLHNRKPLSDTAIDVVLVVDNGYYVTKECLCKALEAVNGALYHLSRGDRVALYTTHCTHQPVTGNRPDLHYPLRPVGADSEDTFRDLTARIAACGRQVWEPPRPNPTMAEVVLGVARSLNDQDLKIGRTHVIVLSPAAYVLHEVSKHFPDLYIHRISPAALPYRRSPELQDTICNDVCCKNVFASNCGSYQSVTGRVKHIIKNARAEKPVGELTDISIDLRTRHGCEIIETCGSKDIPVLRPGQVHTLLVRVRVTQEDTRGVNLASSNPVFNSSLDVKNLRQELQNAVAVGAVKVHLFDVQALHRNSLHTTNCWNYTETPLLIIRKLGGLAPPVDTAMELYKRQYFHKLNQLTAEEAKTEAEKLLATSGGNNEQAKKLIERMAKEIECHRATHGYERNYRQKLPLCPGPIEIEASAHEWLVDLWNKKKIKRNGVAVVNEDDITGLVDGFNGMERLG